MELAYSDDEICDLYKFAEDKLKQLKVLADLNTCKVDVIKKVLETRGYAIPQKKKVKRRGRKYSFDTNIAMELYNMGLNDVAIAKVLNCSRGSVANWRNKMELLPNYNR